MRFITLELCISGKYYGFDAIERDKPHRSDFKIKRIVIKGICLFIHPA